jgi:hypothetical protein
MDPSPEKAAKPFQGQPVRFIFIGILYGIHASIQALANSSQEAQTASALPSGIRDNSDFSASLTPLREKAKSRVLISAASSISPSRIISLYTA